MIELFVLAPLAALLATLPLSPEAHQRVLESVLGVEAARSPALSVARVIAAITMFLATRRTWARTLGRARRRESTGFGLGLAGGLLGAEVLRRMTADVRPSPIAIGAGLVLTAVMLATLRVAPRAAPSPSPLRASVIVASSLALSGLPGGSAVVASSLGLAWSGKRLRADAILALAAPVELVSAMSGVTLTGARRLAELLPVAILVVVLAACGAAVGVSLLRRQLPAIQRLAPRYLFVLGAAQLAFAWALYRS